MAEGYNVTGQTYESERQVDGSYLPVVVVSFTTTGTPPVAGSVTVPRSLLTDKAAYAAKVQALIEQAVSAHNAVASL